jgi:hypothetical protein
MNVIEKKLDNLMWSLITENEIRIMNHDYNHADISQEKLSSLTRSVDILFDVVSIQYQMIKDLQQNSTCNKANKSSQTKQINEMLSFIKSTLDSNDLTTYVPALESIAKSLRSLKNTKRTSKDSKGVHSK